MNHADPLALLPVVCMPIAPDNAKIPSPKSDDDAATHAVLASICALHLTAFVTRYGPVPDAIDHQLIQLGRIGHLRPAVMFSWVGPRTAAAQVWLEKAAIGLTSWSEAGWANPIVTEAHSAGVSWFTASIEEAALDAAQRLRWRGDLPSLRNLAAFTNFGLPPQFDPDHPLFGASAPSAA